MSKFKKKIKKTDFFLKKRANFWGAKIFRHFWKKCIFLQLMARFQTILSIFDQNMGEIC